MMAPGFQIRSVPSTSHLLARRGRGGIGRDADSTTKSSNPKGMASDASGSGGMVSSWCQLPAGSKLPTEENKVVFFDTNLPTLKAQATNPTGAVSVTKFKEQTYCFSHACPSCKIPLTKAKASVSSDGSPIIRCDFCKSSYNLQTGEKMESEDTGGFFGGVIKSVFAANADSAGPLRLFKLGENSKGKLMIDPSP